MCKKSILLFLLFICGDLYADTIFLKKSEKILIGKVIEYKDRSIRFATVDEVIELRSSDIEKIEIGFYGLKATIKTKASPETSEYVLLAYETDTGLLLYDEKTEELRIIKLEEILSAEYQFSFKTKQFREISGGYDVEVILIEEEKKTGTLFQIGPEATTLVSDTEKNVIRNSTIRKIVYTAAPEIKKIVKSELENSKIRIYEFLIPGAYQFRSGRKEAGAFLFFSALFSGLAAEYEYERGKRELQKQTAYNEQILIAGDEYALLQADFECESYYRHKRNNRMFLIMTSLFYSFNLLDLWIWNPASKHSKESDFSVIPSFRISTSLRRVDVDAETNAQIRFQLRF